MKPLVLGSPESRAPCHINIVLLFFLAFQICLLPEGLPQALILLFSHAL
jgi:hypothetical protein